MSKDDSDWKPEADDQSERLFSLTLALSQTEVGLTKDELFSAIRGYRMDVHKAGGIDADLSSLNRKFDRDKDALRQMGISIEPAGKAAIGDSDYRYKISRETFIWPRGAKLSGKQLQILELAASVWSQAALSPEATNALIRLRAISTLGDSEFSSAIAPRLATVEPSFAPLKRAIGENNEVSFHYRKPDGDEAMRRVQPWQLIHRGGLWALIGFDLDRQAARNFLLKRIHSKVTISKDTFDSPNPAVLDRVKAELDALYKSNKAVIQVKPGTTASMHFETQNSATGLVEVNFYDLQLLAEELMEFGRGITVISPPELIELISTNLHQVIKNHA